MKRRPRPISAFPFDEIRAHAQAILDLLEPFKLEMSVRDRNRRLKLPSKNVGAIAVLVHLAKEQGLDAQAAPIEEHWGAALKMDQLRILLDLIGVRAAELRMRSESETWKATTLVYTMLRRIARSDGDLEGQLAPVVQKYFARKAVPAAETTPAAPDPAPPVTKTKKKKARRR